MVENWRTMAQPRTYARLLLAALFYVIFTGSSTMEFETKDVYSQPTVPPARYSAVTEALLLLEPSKTTLGISASAFPHQPGSPLPAARNDDGSGLPEELAGLGYDEYDEKSQHCLALNVYWEARNQAVSGQLAVAQVTMNRVRDPRYPNDICEVVFDHGQFSWYWDGLSDRPKEIRAWKNAILVASAAIHGSGHADLDHVTHYHAVYSQPYWKDYMTLVATIGDHLFYSEQSPVPIID